MTDHDRSPAAMDPAFRGCLVVKVCPADRLLGEGVVLCKLLLGERFQHLAMFKRLQDPSTHSLRICIR